MSPTPKSVILVGAGLASVAAIETLRAEGYEGRICLVGEESRLPYDRPPLSKGFLSGQCTASDILLHEESWYGERRVELELGQRVTGLDLANRRVFTDAGRRLDYDRLLIAVGARARRLEGVWAAAAPQVRYLRTAADADDIRTTAAKDSRVVLVGGGVVGLEVAATLVQRGCRVTVLETADRIMGRFFPPMLSEILAALHAARGVDIRVGVAVEEVDLASGGPVIRLRDGARIAADMLVAGIGVVPNSGLAAAAGLATRLQGIEVDVQGRTVADGVYAAGDVAAFPSRDGTWVRWENWTHARLQAATAARHMLGKSPPGYAEIPWIWSDQYDFNIQVSGNACADRVVLRGGMHSGRLTAFHLQGGRVVGATTLNDSRHKSSIRKLIEHAASVPAERLEDTACDLKQLAAAAARASLDLPREAS